MINKFEFAKKALDNISVKESNPSTKRYESQNNFFTERKCVIINNDTNEETLI